MLGNADGAGRGGGGVGVCDTEGLKLVGGGRLGLEFWLQA